MFLDRFTIQTIYFTSKPLWICSFSLYIEINYVLRTSHWNKEYLWLYFFCVMSYSISLYQIGCVYKRKDNANSVVSIMFPHEKCDVFTVIGNAPIHILMIIGCIKSYTYSRSCHSSSHHLDYYPGTRNHVVNSQLLNWRLSTAGGRSSNECRDLATWRRLSG